MVLDVPLSAIERRTVDEVTAERASATSLSREGISSRHAIFAHKISGSARRPKKLKSLTREPNREGLQQAQGTPVVANYR